MELWIKPEYKGNTENSVIFSKNNGYFPYVANDYANSYGTPIINWYINTATQKMGMIIEMYPNFTKM